MKILSKKLTENEITRILFTSSNLGYWDGKDANSYFLNCKYWLEKFEASVIFTKDVGHHTCGWFKNPDYERCYHLSISFVDKFGNNKPHNTKRANKIVKMLFGYSNKMVWCEPPYSKEGLNKDVWHYRLFCDLNWRPIKPRKEVYTKGYTPKDWKSYSEIEKLRNAKGNSKSFFDI